MAGLLETERVETPVEVASETPDPEDPRFKAARELIIRFEGFQPSGTLDVTPGRPMSENEYRAGYGSDTQTLEDGTVVRVKEGMPYSREDAERDINRRLTNEFIPAAERVFGEDAMAILPSAAYAAIISMAYNYGEGNLRQLTRLKEAVREADLNQIADVIESYADQNEGVNRHRRMEEAATVRNSLTDAIARYTETANEMEEEEWEGIPYALPEGRQERRKRPGVPAGLLRAAGSGGVRSSLDPLSPLEGLSGLGSLLTQE